MATESPEGRRSWQGTENREWRRLGQDDRNRARVEVTPGGSQPHHPSQSELLMQWFSSKKSQADQPSSAGTHPPRMSLTQHRDAIFFFFFLVFNFIYLSIYLFLAVLGLCCCTQAFSSCGEPGATLCCGALTSHCGGFACCGARALGAWASVVVAHGLSSCGTWAQLLRGMWDIPRPGFEPVSPALAGRFLTSVPPGKPLLFSFEIPFPLWPLVVSQKGFPLGRWLPKSFLSHWTLKGKFRHHYPKAGAMHLWVYVTWSYHKQWK